MRARLLSGTLAVLLAAFVLVIYSSWREYERARVAVLDDLQQTAEALAVAVDTTFDQSIAVGQMLAHLPELRALDPEAATARLQAFTAEYPLVKTAALLDPEGTLVAWAPPDPLPEPPLTLVDRAYYREVLRNRRPAVVDLVLSVRTGQPMAGVAVPLLDQRGELLGILVLGFDGDEVGRRLQAIGLRPGQSILVADRNARLAYFSDPTQLTWEQRDLSSFPTIPRALNGEVTRVTNSPARLQGDVRVAVSVPTPAYRWAVGVSWPMEQAFGRIEEAFRQRLLFAALLALLAIVGVVLFSRSLLRPIQLLDEQAAALGRGELHRRVAIRTGDELERLGATFNSMAERLDAALGELRQNEERLSHLAEASLKARERTELLQTLTAQLSAARTPAQVAEVVAQEGRTVLGARAVAINLLRDANSVEIVGSAGYDPEIVDRYQVHTLGRELPTDDAVRTGRPVWLASYETLVARYPALREASFLKRYGAFAAVPLVVAGSPMGSMGIHFDGEHSFEDEERSLILTVAELCSQALERARLYELEQQAVQEREAFMSVAAHELRGPLSALSVSAQLVRQSIAGERMLPPKQLARLVSSIGEQVDKLAKMVAMLLDVSRLTSGHLALDLEPTEMVALLRELVDRTQLQTTEHTLALHAPREAVLPVDRLRIEQVFTNLLDNAVKYSPNGGEIEVSVDVATPEWIEIAVADQGQGIPPEDLPHVFERFYQVGGTGSRPGLGLGLYVCRQIVELHGGELRVASELGHGTRIVVRLPTVAPSGGESVAAAARGAEA